MTSLSAKIKQLRPNVIDSDFEPQGNIWLQDDSNGQGPYIKEWNHPTETQPTQAELDSIE